ncbi:MAG: DNA replication/repair protein RecF [Gammaproteobacteria bacterium]|uniref:DNA replication and repair protein RecF n=1 Tax=Candidatus Thiopontia autotrophica TaxID=2841688 RepID=A0A8J6PD33_9GAMM|nr:DNA replication/repair protein RecF [Candidatus Thiopontia autotrophica]
MYIRSLAVSDCRIISNAEIVPSPGFNLICGENGSGKSSLLEAIYLLGTGRSFRSPSPSSLVKYGKNILTVFAEIESPSGQLFSVGMERGKNNNRLHINRSPTIRLSEAAEILPLQIITPDSINLVIGAPRSRRSFLDWGMFHVEPDFLNVVKRYKKTVRQRNALLKRERRAGSELSYWNELLADDGEKITAYRRDYLDEIVEIYQEKISTLMESLSGLDITFSYRKGWSGSGDLLGAIEGSTEKDIATGRTTHGPHEADFIISSNKGKAKDVLSRGQAKLLSIELYLSQLYHLHEKMGKRAVILLDDIFSELDRNNGFLILNYLVSGGYQVFATTTDPGLKLPDIGNVEMFHVEHGDIIHQ